METDSELFARIELEDRKERVKSHTPKLFLHTDRAKLPHPECLASALEWGKSGCPKGLVLYGPTGSGKSRIMWELAKELTLSRGMYSECANSFSIAKYPSMLMSGDGAAGKFTSSLVKTKLLLLDDVFKAKLTERVEELLFSVIDERFNRETPTVVTLNDTGETLIARMSPDRGDAMVRRLREFKRIFVGDNNVQKTPTTQVR